MFKKIVKTFALASLFIVFISCTSSNAEKSLNQEPYQQKEGLEKAYFASGCFWCVEAIFENVIGVDEVISGYSGGIIKNPTYEQICTGTLKHAEAVEVHYDPKVIDYETLLKVFFGSHDPTTINRQGPDSGPQYRSMIYFQNEKEKNAAAVYIKSLTAKKEFSKEIVTEVVAFDVFYMAESYHQDYEKKHPNNSYIKAVSIPRLLKFEAKFPELLKEKH